LAKSIKPDVQDDVTILPLTLASPVNIGAMMQLARILRRNHIDILHSHLFRASLAASPMGWLCGVPVVVETTHVRELWRRGWIKSHYFVDRIAGRFVDRYIAVSEANAQYLETTKRVPARKIVTIQNGCDLDKFDPERAKPLELKKQLGFAPDDPVLVVGARLEPQKGHRVLIEALPLIRAHFRNVRLVCAGDGSLRNELERLVDTLQLEQAVRFVGHQPVIADWLALGDIIVLPSFFEGLPLIAIEALAAGRPVVASAVDGTVEVVINETTGLTVSPGDARALADAILRLLRDPEFRMQLAEAGRRMVVERFSMGRQVEATQDLYLRAWREARGEISLGRADAVFPTSR